MLHVRLGLFFFFNIKIITFATFILFFFQKTFTRFVWGAKTLNLKGEKIEVWGISALPAREQRLGHEGEWMCWQLMKLQPIKEGWEPNPTRNLPLAAAAKRGWKATPFSFSPCSFFQSSWQEDSLPARAKVQSNSLPSLFPPMTLHISLQSSFSPGKVKGLGFALSLCLSLTLHAFRGKKNGK